jgi:hypothetical protein
MHETRRSWQHTLRFFQRPIEPVAADLGKRGLALLEFLLAVAVVLAVAGTLRLYEIGRRRLAEFANRPADPLFAAFFRVSFAALGLWYAWTELKFIEFNWYSRTPEFRSIVLYAHLGWMAMLGLMLVGCSAFLVRAIHFAFAVWILNAVDTGSTVSTDLYLICSFWLLFMTPDGRLTPRVFGGSAAGDKPAPGGSGPKAWPYVLMGFNDAVLVLTAGITKFYDPFWARGIGFYETFSLPWIKTPESTVLLNAHWLMVALNYLTIAHELLFFPLFFFRKTRPLACIVYLGFYASLTYPLRIDFIGPLGLVHGVGLIAGTPELARWLRRLFGGRPADVSDAQPRVEVGTHPRLSLPQAVVLVLVLFVAVATAQATTLTRFAPYNAYPPLKVAPDGNPLPGDSFTQSIPVEGLERWRRDALNLVVNNITSRRWYQPFDFINRIATRMSSKSLFCAGHFFGVYAFRVVVTLDDGTKVEPVRVFNHDKTGGPDSLGLGSPRCLQRCMYDVTSICGHRLADPNRLSPTAPQLLERLMHFSLTRLPAEQRSRAATMQVLVSPIVMPLDYEADSRPWLDYPWTTLYERDLAKGTADFMDVPSRFPYRLVSLNPG